MSVTAGDRRRLYKLAARELCSTVRDERVRRAVDVVLDALPEAITPGEAEAMLHKLGGLTDYSRRLAEQCRLKLVDLSSARGSDGR